jgi:hypothetical protein
MGLRKTKISFLIPPPPFALLMGLRRTRMRASLSPRPIQTNGAAENTNLLIADSSAPFALLMGLRRFELRLRGPEPRVILLKGNQENPVFLCQATLQPRCIAMNCWPLLKLFLFLGALADRPSENEQIDQDCWV